MGYVSGEDRRQSVLFPEYLDDYVLPDNPIRFIDAFVERLDLRELGFEKAEPKVIGRPAYHPGVLLRLYVYGYLNNIRTSRKLERAAHRNVEVMWLMGRLTPDHKTIADFRKDNLEAIKEVWREFSKLCKQMGLYGGELIAVDGSKFRASNSRERNFTKKELDKLISRIDQRIDKYIAELDEGDEREAEVKSPTAEELKEKIEALKNRKQTHQQRREKLNQSGETQISLTDSDSRLMKTREGSNVCYNVQMAVDSKHKLIVAFEATNAVNDFQQLASITKQAQKELGVEQLEAVADMGYYDCGEVKKCEDEGINVYVVKPALNRGNGLFSKEEFRYNAEKDVYVCPAGEELGYRWEEKARQIKYYETSACQNCPMRSRCTTGKKRRIKRLVDEEVIERMMARVRAGPEKLRLRKQLVEHPFGTIKRNMGQGYFLMRGKMKVGAEFGLTSLAYNMKRVINIVGVPIMLEALM
jgi:transposase